MSVQVDAEDKVHCLPSVPTTMGEIDAKMVNALAHVNWKQTKTAFALKIGTLAIVYTNINQLVDLKMLIYMIIIKQYTSKLIKLIQLIFFYSYSTSV